MKHYGIVQLVDFARGLAPAEEARLMREHLASGCPECRQMAEFCEKVSRICQRMALRPVPDSLMEQARALFPVRLTERRKRMFHLPVELIYDNLLAPAPVGLRSTWQIGWQALYRAGDCSLDLRVEPELHSSRAAIIGQVSSHAAPETQMGGIPVCLKTGRAVVAETRSNRFGEFRMEFEQRRQLQLCVYLEDGTQCIQVPVKRLGADTAVGKRSVRLGKKLSELEQSKGWYDLQMARCDTKRYFSHCPDPAGVGPGSVFGPCQRERR